MPCRRRSAPCSFPSRKPGCAGRFLEQARAGGFEAIGLRHDTPRLLAALRELLAVLRARARICCAATATRPTCWASWPAGGWASPSFPSRGAGPASAARVRLYEAIDRRVLRWMDKVICVSAAQAQKVRRAGVREKRILVIRNAIRPERFKDPDPAYREQLRRMFPEPVRQIVGAAGRLSPEKGFAVLVDAAAEVVKTSPAVGFVVFGDGPLRASLARQIAAKGLEGRFLLAGFRSDLDRFLPQLDVLVLPSFTEGLPNVALEALAAGVPVVGTAVGGTPEVVEDGRTGCLVPPGNPQAMADRIGWVLGDDAAARELRREGLRCGRGAFFLRRASPGVRASDRTSVRRAKVRAAANGRRPFRRLVARQNAKHSRQHGGNAVGKEGSRRPGKMVRCVPARLRLWQVLARRRRLILTFHRMRPAGRQARSVRHLPQRIGRRFPRDFDLRTGAICDGAAGGALARRRRKQAGGGHHLRRRLARQL